MVQNKGILKAIDKAKEEYDKSLNAMVNKGVGISMSDEAVASVRENVADNLQDLIWNKYNEISRSDQNKNTEREINGILHVDDNVDYDDLSNPNQRTQYDTKIAGLDVNIEHWKDLEEKEQDPTKTLLYKTAKELCIAKKSHMEVKAGFRPESWDKKWAKENIAGVLAVTISITGIIMTVVMAGRKAVKQGAKAMAEFGKAITNLEKKAAPAIATILNILAQVLTWGALAITYFLYNEVRERRRAR